MDINEKTLEMIQVYNGNRGYKLMPSWMYYNGVLYKCDTDDENGDSVKPVLYVRNNLRDTSVNIPIGVLKRCKEVDREACLVRDAINREKYNVKRN